MMLTSCWRSHGALTAQGKLEAARDEYEAALVTCPRYAAALKQLGGVQLARREFAAAEAALVAALEEQPGFTAAWADLGATRRWLGDLDGAITALQFAAFQTPDDTLVHWTLAHVQVREKNRRPPCRPATDAVLQRGLRRTPLRSPRPSLFAVPSPRSAARTDSERFPFPLARPSPPTLNGSWNNARWRWGAIARELS